MTNIFSINILKFSDFQILTLEYTYSSGFFKDF